MRKKEIQMFASVRTKKKHVIYLYPVKGISVKRKEDTQRIWWLSWWMIRGELI